MAKIKFKKTQRKRLIGRKTKSVFKLWRGTREEMKKFHASVTKLIETHCKNNSKSSNLFENFLYSARSVNEFKRIVLAFPFESWSDSIKIDSNQLVLNILKVNDAYINDALAYEKASQDKATLEDRVTQYEMSNLPFKHEL